MVTSVILAVLLCCYGTLGDDINPCPNSLKRSAYLHAFGNRCFEFVTYRETYWDNANKECQLKGGQLATVNDDKTQSFLEDTLMKMNWIHNGLWIGLNDLKWEGQYEWASGEALKYVNWAPGQPSLFHNVEDCVLMYRPDNYAWRDHECHIWPQYYGYICEYRVHQSNTSATASITTRPIQIPSGQTTQAAAVPTSATSTHLNPV